MPTDTVSHLESELRALEESGGDSRRRVDVLLAMADAVVIDNPQSAVEMCNEAVAMSRRLAYATGIAMGLGYLGWAESSLSQFEPALAHLHEAKSLLEQGDEHNGYGRVLMALAGVHRSLGNVELAYETTMNALKVFRADGDLINEGWTLYGLAGGHADAGDFDHALEVFNQSLRLFARAEHETRDDRAVMGRARSLNGIGGIYESRGQLDLALMYHRDSLPIFRKLKTPLGEARALDDLGIIYQKQDEFACALECHTEGLQLREQVGNRQAQSTSLINLGTLYTRMGRLDDALEVLTRALTIAQDVKSRPKEFQAHAALSTAYQAKGDLPKALEHHELFHQIRDHVVGDQTKARVRNIQIAFAVESAEQQTEIERLRNVELKETNERLEQLLNELKETQIQLVQSEKMASLGQLVSSLVHELNTPIGTIESALDLYDRGTSNIAGVVESASSIDDLKTNDRFVRSVKAMRENRNISADAMGRITKMVRSLKSFVRLDESPLQHVDVHRGIEDTLTLLGQEIGKRITINRDFNTCPPITGNPGELNQVFMNLLSNAAQAIVDEGTIKIRTYFADGSVMIEISDTGAGIPADQIRQLFDPGFSKRGSRIKAGLGLFTSYNIVQKHGGNIRVDSTMGQGTTFSISLPVTNPLNT